MLFADPSPLPSNCTDYQVRLQQRGSPNRGVVQICLNGAWAAICSGGIDYKGAQLMCNQLGFQGEGMLMQVVSYYINNME